MVAVSKLEGRAPLIQKSQPGGVRTACGAEQELNFTPAPWQGVLDSEQPVQLHTVDCITDLCPEVARPPFLLPSNELNREASSENFLMSFSAQDRPGRE